MNKDLMNLKINASDIKRRVNKKLNVDLQERKIYMKYKIFKTTAIAAVLIIISAVSVFAVSPAGYETINGIIEYFQNDKAHEITSIKELAKYNNEIGQSCTKDGITLTLNNIAADDNYVHVFYTIKSDTPFYEGENPRIGASLFSDEHEAIWVDCMIDGKFAGRESNHNSYNSYFTDPYTYTAVNKYNVSTRDLPEQFTVELFAEKYKDENSIIASFKNEKKGFTDDEKSKLWYVSAWADKSKVKVESVTKEINTRLPWSGVMVEKAVFSPFGNQLVISTSAGSDAGYAAIDMFALTDENGKYLDVLNTDLRRNADGSSVNSLEFLKADKNTNRLTFIPIGYNENVDCNITECPVGEYPITYKVSDYGNVVVTDVRVSDGQIEIDYYKDGFIMYDPGFSLLDSSGNNVEPGGKLGCVLYTDVHYDTNSYTARYVYDAYDDNGKPIPMGDDVKADALRRKFTTLGVVEQMYWTLDFNNAVTVDLSKN